MFLLSIENFQKSFRDVKYVSGLVELASAQNTDENILQLFNTHEVLIKERNM